jgi:hypothetical protein
MSRCIESTIDVKADTRYEREVAGNIAISVGVGMVILLVIILFLNMKGLSIFFNDNLFNKSIKLFDFDGKMPYPAVMIIFFLISLSCFIGYGSRMKVGKGPTKKKDTVVSWLLAAAILFLLMSATMLWFKAYVYTSSV